MAFRVRKAQQKIKEKQNEKINHKSTLTTVSSPQFPPPQFPVSHNSIQFKLHSTWLHTHTNENKNTDKLPYLMTCVDGCGCVGARAAHGMCFCLFCLLCFGRRESGTGDDPSLSSVLRLPGSCFFLVLAFGGESSSSLPFFPYSIIYCVTLNCVLLLLFSKATGKEEVPPRVCCLLLLAEGWVLELVVWQSVVMSQLSISQSVSQFTQWNKNTC